jgi:hypothetical protein
MKIAINDMPAKTSREDGVNGGNGIHGGRIALPGVARAWGSKLSQEGIDSRASEPAGPAFSEASGEVRECGARSEASAA